MTKTAVTSCVLVMVGFVVSIGVSVNYSRGLLLDAGAHDVVQSVHLSQVMIERERENFIRHKTTQTQ